MKTGVDSYDAVMTAVARKNAKGAVVDCLGGTHMAYLVGAAEALVQNQSGGFVWADPYS